MAATSRQFPGHMRADMQAAIDRLFSDRPIRFFGIHERQPLRDTDDRRTDAHMGGYAYAIAPAQYHDVDVGESEPVKCLNNGLWLCLADELRYAVLLSSHREYGYEIRNPRRDRRACRRRRAANSSDAVSPSWRAPSTPRVAIAARSCRSMPTRNYQGRSKGVTVHRLPPVRREDVILPEATLKLLDRNVLNFVGSRPQLRRLGQSTRKGILLYGPPGTGKTHTIRYLASNLPDHTTLIITAAQVALLAHYMSLARLSAASDGRDRGCRSHCARSRRDGTVRGIVAQQAAQRDGWTEGGCRYPVHPDHQPAGAA